MSLVERNLTERGGVSKPVGCCVFDVSVDERNVEGFGSDVVVETNDRNNEYYNRCDTGRQ